ncbi:MAG: hypothetical protein HY313_11585 [Acidobacteria bacterium]|nr:hypothetical protein [Acidobacteriota bacterium]
MSPATDRLDGYPGTNEARCTRDLVSDDECVKNPLQYTYDRRNPIDSIAS